MFSGWILWKRMMHIVPLLHVVTLQLLVLMHNELLVLIKLWQEWVRFEH